MEFLIVQLPRGRTAVVQFNSATGAVTTSHAGLIGTLFRKGVMDFEGSRRFPSDGRTFLAAVYDHLFLRNYAVHWMRAGRKPGSISKRAE
jgi:hypothetical protein